MHCLTLLLGIANINRVNQLKVIVTAGTLQSSPWWGGQEMSWYEGRMWRLGERAPLILLPIRHSWIKTMAIWPWHSLPSSHLWMVFRDSSSSKLQGIRAEIPIVIWWYHVSDARPALSLCLWWSWSSSFSSIFHWKKTLLQALKKAQASLCAPVPT